MLLIAASRLHTRHQSYAGKLHASHQVPSTVSVAIALPQSSRVGVGAALPTKTFCKDPLKSEAILPLARSLAAGCECGCAKPSGHQVWQSAGLLEPATLRALPRWFLTVCFNLVGSDPRTVALLAIST